MPDIHFMCRYCDELTSIPKKRYNERMKRRQLLYCSRRCGIDHKKTGRQVECLECADKTLNALFCSQSCAATYNNKKREQGILRGKLEVWLEPRLIEEMPNVEFHFNRKDSVGSELDIYCPKLKLAIEIQGAFHFLPIFGLGVLKATQKNDMLKREACKKHGVKLVEIDTSPVSYVTTKTGWKYLRMIMEAVNERMETIS